VPPRPRPLKASLRVADKATSAMTERIVSLLEKHDPQLLEGMTDVGVIDREWVENRSGRPMSSATPFEVLERALARTVERRPSMLAKLGLSAVQVLATAGEEDLSADPSVERAVAFTDLEGFTEHTARNGDAAAAQLLAAHYGVAGPIVRSRGGRLVKKLGDGLLMTFPDPAAAVLAVLELTECPPEPLRVRAGVHIGPVMQQRADVVGHVVNVAARVTEAAKGGEVVVTRDVREAVADALPQVAFGPARPRKLKGLETPVAVSRVRRR
jgi:adenylate cyclase